MAIDIAVATDDMLPAIHTLDGRAFAISYTEADRAANAEVLDLDRFRVALDGSEIVGAAGSYEVELTLPGGAMVPMTAITWVSVAVTHRRQGILRRLMDAVHEDGAERGEPLLGLTASEGGIYRRFGFGIATTIAATEIDRRQADIDESLLPAPGSVRLVDATAAIGAMTERYDRYRRLQPGEISRSEARIGQQVHQWGAGAVVALHDDGYAAWTVEANENNGHPATSSRCATSSQHLTRRTPRSGPRSCPSISSARCGRWASSPPMMHSSTCCRTPGPFARSQHTTMCGSGPSTSQPASPHVRTEPMTVWCWGSTAPTGRSPPTTAAGPTTPRTSRWHPTRSGRCSSAASVHRH